MSASERGRRRLFVFALVVAVLFGGLAFASWWTGRDDLRPGSKVLSGGGPALRIAEVPTSYRAVFRIDDRAGAELVTMTERVWVRRPFQSRIESYAGPPPGTGRPTIRQSALGVLASISPRSQPLNISVPPSVASGDLRIDAALREALSEDTILRRERREVYGRECQVYRFGGPVLAGDIVKYVPRSGEYADVCIDRNGIVIEQYWVRRGRLIQRRAAVELEIDTAIDRTLFDIDVPKSTGSLAGAVERIDRQRVPGLWVLPAPPAGFDLLGRYAVVIPQAALPQQGQQLPGPGPSSTTDVYVRGPDLVVVDQDPSLAEYVRREDRPVRKVDLPNLRNGQLIVDARMNEVRGQSPDGSIVRLVGTLPPDELVALARRLQVQE